MKRPHPSDDYNEVPSRRILIAPQDVDKTTNPFYIIEKKIYLSTLSPLYKEAYNTLVQISIPDSRPTYMHEYSITSYSILKAITLGYTNQKILQFLNKYMRNKTIPPLLVTFIELTTKRYTGSAKLHLDEQKQHNFFYLQMKPEAFKALQYYEDKDGKFVDQIYYDGIIKDEQLIQNQKSQILICKVKPYRQNIIARMLYTKEVPFHFEFSYKRKLELEINKNKKMTNMNLLDGRLLLKDLKIELKAFTKLRHYQQAALKSIFFIDDRKVGGEFVKEDIAKSGVIVLPCGAGKTLLGISVACKIKKQTLIICSGQVGVEQWKRQILKWTSELQPNQIVTLTSKTEKNFTYKFNKSDPILVISSYPYLASKFDPKKELGLQMQWLRKLPWGLVLFDEVQWLPASSYRLILDNIQSHIRIGLTATLYREDQKIKDLDYMIGPLLYEGNWRDFVDSGFLANPYCIEIRCQLTAFFKQQYRKQKRSKQDNEMIECSNPNKIKALIYLLKIHQNDQTIVFCDYIALIKKLAEKFKIPAIYGDVPTEDRNFVYEMFRRGQFKTVILSRTSDEAIDLPNANVAIEFTINRGSRKQVLQRLGRIMRQKDNPTMDYNALFYTMVSQGTNEKQHFSKRQKTLVDLGFQYDIINEKDMDYNTVGSQYYSTVSKNQIHDQSQYLSRMIKTQNQQNPKKKKQ